jgi:preprotein translocase subunit SecE
MVKTLNRKTAEREGTSQSLQRVGAFTKARNFFTEVRIELQKASWPWDPKEKGFKKYRELFDDTVLVVIAMLLLGGYVALFDFILLNVVHFFSRFH